VAKIKNKDFENKNKALFLKIKQETNLLEEIEAQL